LYSAVESCHKSQNVVCRGQPDIVDIFRSSTGVVASQNSVPVRIVPCPFLGIREYLVSGLDLGEESRGIFDVAIVPVRVEFESLSSVSLLDPGNDLARSGERTRGSHRYSLLVRCLSINIQKLIVIHLGLSFLLPWAGVGLILAHEPGNRLNVVSRCVSRRCWRAECSALYRQ
jgi:hypothetical protein